MKRHLRSRPALSAAFAVTATIACGPDAPQRTEILWDTWGVPHIFATSDEELFRAFGWAQMESHGDLILRLYGQARARGAEYWGEEHLSGDAWLRTVGVPERARQWYQGQSPEFRNYLDAFADGINAYAAEHADRIVDDVKVVLPVSAIDVLAHAQRAILFTFVTSADAVSAVGRRWQPAGSNAWAIGPSRSASGNAMLLANPHLPWSGHFLFYEAQLRGPGIDAYGSTLVGLPVLGIAFNDYLGWTHTVNTQDGADLYELRLAAGGYVYDGEVRPFDSKTHTLEVRMDGGDYRVESIEVRRSLHGPVVGERGGSALALRIVGLDRPQMLEQWWEMSRARSLRQFEAALKRMQLPMFTVMYADRDGHIMHLFGGLTPVRPAGDWNWSGIVPGQTSATLWSETHAYDELPRVVDPASGWLQNANDPPWTTTFPRALDPHDYPSYLAPRFMHFRAQRSARMLAEDEKISYDELLEYKHSTRSELADRILDEAVEAARASGSERARAAADVLEAWDREMDADSRGGTLFVAFYEELTKRSPASFFSVPWDPAKPLETPDGLADPQIAVEALDAAAAALQERFGSLDVRFGDVYRLRIGGLDLPANGMSGELGVFRTTWFRSAPDGLLEAFGGDSYVAIVEFSDPVRAVAATGYGNASQPGSPHLSDQAQFYYSKTLRPVWRTREEIEANLSARTSFE